MRMLAIFGTVASQYYATVLWIMTRSQEKDLYSDHPDLWGDKG